jgi:uncharacterized protein YhfF
VTEDLPKAEFAFPGPLRDQLVAAILDGSKTSTTGLLLEYDLEGTTLEPVGERSLVVDSADRPVAIIELTEISTCRVGDVDLQHAIDEGEGYTSVAEWRTGHESFWHSDEYRDAVNDPTFTVTDDTIAVVLRFRLVERL